MLFLNSWTAAINDVYVPFSHGHKHFDVSSLVLELLVHLQWFWHFPLLVCSCVLLEFLQTVYTRKPSGLWYSFILWWLFRWGIREAKSFLNELDAFSCDGLCLSVEMHKVLGILVLLLSLTSWKTFGRRKKQGRILAAGKGGKSFQVNNTNSCAYPTDDHSALKSPWELLPLRSITPDSNSNPFQEG